MISASAVKFENLSIPENFKKYFFIYLFIYLFFLKNGTKHRVTPLPKLLLLDNEV
jgi:hypothetical protein